MFGEHGEEFRSLTAQEQEMVLQRVVSHELETQTSLATACNPNQMDALDHLNNYIQGRPNSESLGEILAPFEKRFAQNCLLSLTGLYEHLSSQEIVSMERKTAIIHLGTEFTSPHASRSSEALSDGLKNLDIAVRSPSMAQFVEMNPSNADKWYNSAAFLSWIFNHNRKISKDSVARTGPEVISQEQVEHLFNERYVETCQYFARGELGKIMTTMVQLARAISLTDSMIASRKTETLMKMAAGYAVCGELGKADYGKVVKMLHRRINEVEGSS